MDERGERIMVSRRRCRQIHHPPAYRPAGRVSPLKDSLRLHVMPNLYGHAAPLKKQGKQSSASSRRARRRRTGFRAVRGWQPLLRAPPRAPEVE
jgi:hypothetical protein